MKVNIILSPSQQVNNSCVMGDSEADHCRSIALRVAEKLKDYNCNVWVVPKVLGTESEKLQKICNSSNYFVETNPADYSYHLDIHTDAGYNATGASGFYLSEGGKFFIQQIHQQISQITPWADGLVSRRLLYVLRHTIAIAGLIELSFHDDITEASWIHENENLIATALVKGLVKATMIEAKEIELTLDRAVSILADKKIINSKDYWLKTCDIVKYQKDLLMNMARYVIKKEP